MNCLNCGKELINTNQKFCINCGSELPIESITLQSDFNSSQYTLIDESSYVPISSSPHINRLPPSNRPSRAKRLPPKYPKFEKLEGPPGPYSKSSLVFGLLSIIIMGTTMISETCYILQFNMISGTYYILQLYNKQIVPYLLMVGIGIHALGLLCGILAKRFSSEALYEPNNMTVKSGKVLGLFGIIFNAGILGISSLVYALSIFE